jgi:hypothetical protein
MAITFLDKLTGYSWRTATEEDIVITSVLSAAQNLDDAVGVERRYEWCERNPFSLWVGSRCGHVEITIQLHVLAKFLTTIWREGRILEADKTANDLRTYAELNLELLPMQWYLELILFHNDILRLDRQIAMEGLIRGLTAITKTVRRRCGEDTLLTLPICFNSCRDVASLLTLRTLGLQSPQKGYPLLGTRLANIFENYQILYPIGNN